MIAGTGDGARTLQRALDERLLALERERAIAHDRVRQLTALHGAFAEIAAAGEPAEVVGTTLRAVVETLDFGRALWITYDGSTFAAERMLEASDAVPGIGRPRAGETDRAPHTQRAAGRYAEASRTLWPVANAAALQRLLRCAPRSLSGLGTDLDAPFVDAGRWYAAAISGARGAPAVVYADGHRTTKPSAWRCTALEHLGVIASVALDNAAMLSAMRELALRDPLTGLLNRRAFADRLAQEIDYCKRAQRCATLALVDVDDFKRVNDTFGHAFGDTVLKAVATTLAVTKRAHDVVGRFAGDEFVALFVDTDPTLARALVARLSDALRAREVCCSVGAASFPLDARDADDLFARADGALYAAKRAGKNRFAFA